MSTVRPSTPQKLPKQGGMGFVEVLVASVILALTVAGSVTLLGGWTQTLSETRNRTDALVRLVSVMDLGKHEIALVNPSDPNYNASLVNGVVSPTQRISGFTLGDITAVAGVNRTKFEASIAWLNPYESGGDANSKFGLQSYHPERRGFVSVSSPTVPVCVGVSCPGVDDDCIVSTGSKKGKGKSKKSDGTDCNTTSKSKSSKSVTYKNDKSDSVSCTATSQTVNIVGYPGSLTLGQSGNLTATASGGSNNPISFSSLTPNSCSVSGSTLTSVGEGVCTFKAVQPGQNCTYAEGSDQKTINIGCPAFNPLSFSGLQTSDIVDNSVQVSGSNVSGGSTFTPSSYNIGVSGACSLSGTTLTYGPSTGTCTVTATQTGVCTSGVQGISIGITVEGEVCEALYGTYVDSKGKAKEGYYLPDTTACQCYSVSSKSGKLKSATGKSQKAQCPSAKTKSEKYP